MIYAKPSSSVRSYISKLLFGFLFIGMHSSVWAQTEEAKLTAPSGNERDFFGRSVSISADGSAAIIGADGVEDDELNDDMGSAYIFRRGADGDWNYEDKLTAFDGLAGNHIGVSVSLDADGTTALVGSRNDGANFNSGSAYIFSKNEGTWFEEAELGDPDEQEGVFGRPVSLSDDGRVALVGYTIFILNDMKEWIRAADLENNQTDNDTNYGANTVLSADGQTALVTASDEDIEDGNTTGSVYVFTEDGSGKWNEQDKLSISDGGANDIFGTSVSVNADGTVALIGSDQDEIGDTAYMDSIYVFARGESGSWSRQAQLGTPGGLDEDEFGWSTSLSADGKRAAIGAYADQAYIFKYDSEDGWTEEQELKSADVEDGDHFGASVSMSKNGSVVLVGAHGDDIGDENLQGSAYVFGVEIGAASPVVLSESVTNITENEAQLHARVNPNGSETEVYFEYYLSSEPDNVQTISAEPGILNGSYGQDVSATLSNLESGTDYSFRVVTENSEGISIGSETTFITNESTSIQNTEDEIPGHYTLQQNYPNPFNPATTIRYGLPENTEVSIEVYNTLGKRVATLIQNEKQAAGWYEIYFDASHLSSGTYIYRIQTPEFSESKHLILVK